VKHVLVIALAATALGACVSEGVMLAAVRSCEEAGVTRSDPYFDTCLQANRLQANQTALDSAYRRALNPTYDKRGLAHQWHGF
jgi:hypothetical protein